MACAGTIFGDGQNFITKEQLWFPELSRRPFQVLRSAISCPEIACRTVGACHRRLLRHRWTISRLGWELPTRPTGRKVSWASWPAGLARQASVSGLADSSRQL